MEDTLLNSLNSLETQFNALITTLTTSSTLSTAPAQTTSLLVADDSLTLALTQLKQHQENHARILRLRAEAHRLEEQIKHVVRHTIELRREVVNISPSVLDDSDSDSDNAGDNADAAREIDYATLLAFGTRIGKHNALAAREAGEAKLERDLALKRRRDEAKGGRNGNTSANGATSTTTAPNATRRGGEVEDVQMDDSELVQSDHRRTDGGAGGTAGRGAVAREAPAPNIPEVSRHELSMLDQAVAAERAEKGMAFPQAEVLRQGLLGRVQWIRENEGEDGVEAYLRTVLEDEAGGAGERVVGDPGGDGEGQDEAMKDPESVPSVQSTTRAQLPPPPTPKVRRDSAVQAGQVPRQTPVEGKVKKVKLDLWEEGDSD